MENKKQRIFHKYPKATLFIVYFVLLSLFLLLAELICQTFLKQVLGEESYDLVFNLNVPQNCDQSYFDPLLGYAHSQCTRNNIKQIPSFVVYRSNSPKSLTPIKIVTLGGSTTDPILFSKNSSIGPDNWPKLLRDRCQEEQLSCEVFNGGSGGFNSSQELLKLIRDAQPLQPDIIVSLNGINEWYFNEPRLARYPYLSKYQQDLALKFVKNGQATRFKAGYQGSLLNRFMPNVRAIIDRLSIQTAVTLQTSKTDEVREFVPSLELNFGTPYDAKPWDIWYRNVILMHSISKTLGVEYYVFLQPTMGVGDYKYSAGDLAIKKNKGARYYREINEIYDRLRLKCSTLDFCTDLSNVFQGQSNLYRDPRHPNAKGNRIQAEAIFSILARDEYFDYEQ
ncbi:MAG: hypothetical protein QNJ54_26795 [Prochloraceae cyanobacterium]|nr:hypothetical protein [Prochloraceae cyanobacterium]